ncbi:hypothetical protein BS1321_24490 [Peribacillus simplex NBRC 15720 = DSM 1321]|uniref:Uncharacterized protein n=1 Tax=Peribacillus simplex NBRC 15720 = DSM 1321 TaxID=1349754 RepID=A0A223ENN3_9BACI|nr:hypothetical protein BS1321_24490 [Peribacillus simplex NBRC 15720 = DSM 1321]
MIFSFKIHRLFPQPFSYCAIDFFNDKQGMSFQESHYLYIKRRNVGQKTKLNLMNICIIFIMCRKQLKMEK